MDYSAFMNLVEPQKQLVEKCFTNWDRDPVLIFMEIKNPINKLKEISVGSIAQSQYR